MENEVSREEINVMLSEALTTGLPETANNEADQNKVNDTSKVEDSQETPKAEESGDRQNDLLKNRNEILEKAALEKEQEIINKKREDELKSKESVVEDKQEEETYSKEDIKAEVERVLKAKEKEAQKEAKKQEEFNNLLNDYVAKNPNDAKLSDEIKKVMVAHPTLTPTAAAILARQLNPSSQNLTVGDRSNPSLRDSDKPLDKMSLNELRNSNEVKDALKSIGF